MSEPIWLKKAEIERLHYRIIEKTGGPHGLRDPGLLDSALSRPKNQYSYGQKDTFHIAASYAESIAKNHPFVDGNKRIGFMAADAFLHRNGYELLPRRDNKHVDMMENISQGKVSRGQVADHLRQNSRQKEQQRETERAGRRDWSKEAFEAERREAFKTQPVKQAPSQNRSRKR